MEKNGEKEGKKALKKEGILIQNPGRVRKRVGKKVGKSVEFDGGEGVYS